MFIQLPVILQLAFNNRPGLSPLLGSEDKPSKLEAAYPQIRSSSLVTLASNAVCDVLIQCN
jgi:hypothetical protein